jgi:hypothetical protein
MTVLNIRDKSSRDLLLESMLILRFDNCQSYEQANVNLGYSRA